MAKSTRHVHFCDTRECMAEENHMLRKLATGVLPSQIERDLIDTQQYHSHTSEVWTSFYGQVGGLRRQEDDFERKYTIWHDTGIKARRGAEKKKVH